MALLLDYILIFFLIISLSHAYDIGVYAATPGGIAAAVTAAKSSSLLSIVLIEPSENIGGMSYAGGIGLRDLGLEITS